MYILSKLILLESLGLVPIGGGGGLCSHEDLREGEGGLVGDQEVGEEADGARPSFVQTEGIVGSPGRPVTCHMSHRTQCHKSNYLVTRSGYLFG